tara:strand:+ start:989 stop:1210 length:222 start_codon:yes stop_codon:yes gene_type:complete
MVIEHICFPRDTLGGKQMFINLVSQGCGMDKRGQATETGLPMEYILILVALVFIFAVAVFLLRGQMAELNPFK